MSNQDEVPQRYYRKVIRVRATDSPNVQLGMAQQKAGLKPTGVKPDGSMLVPGILSWQDYQKRLATWDKVRQTIGLFAEFWEGADALMYPPDWLARAQRLAIEYDDASRQAIAMGVDSAEGGDKTTMAVIDEKGLIHMSSKKTPDTSVIVKEAIYTGRAFGIPPENWYFDAGGGGKEHADRLRDMGYPVNTVFFGASVTPVLAEGGASYKDFWAKIEDKEARYAYVNKRAEMYGRLRILLNPSYKTGFAIPSEYQELLNQLSVIPFLLDQEGRIRMLSKSKKSRTSKEQTLTELIGHSPDEADALVLAVNGLVHSVEQAVAGPAWD